MSPVNSPDISSLTAEQKRELLAQLMRRKAAQETATKQAQPSTKSDTAPLSFAQQRLWFVDQLQPSQTVYTIPAVLRLQGDLQIDVLQRCLDEIVARHEILRTQFVMAEGNPVQKILPTQKIELSVVELSSIEALSTGSPSSSKNGTTATENQGSSDQGTESDELVISQLRPYLQTLIAEPFDLESGPLLRSHLIKLGDQDHILAVTVHHIVADYWSLKVLMKEIALLYQAFVNHQPSPLPELPIQYGDYAAWQHTQQDNVETQLNYWLNQLAEPPAVLQLPTDHPRPVLQSFNGARHNFSLSPELSQAIAQLSQRSQATVFMTLLAAFKVLLYRYSGQADILVGSTVSNRDRTETKDLIGLFVNNLVFRSNLTAEQTFEQFLQQIKETALAAYSHKDIPFEQVVDALKVERQLSHNALFQVMFILHNTPTSTFTLPALTISALDLNNNASRFDLSLDMYENDTGLTGVFEYSTDLFEASTIDQIAAHFETLLEGIVASPDAPVGSLPLLSEAEVNELNSWNQTTAEIPSQCAHQLIEAQAEKAPEAISLSTDHIVSDNVLSQFFLTGQPWTYQQLNNRANQLAHYLSANSVQPGDRIALAMGRSVNLVIAILATLKLGAIYIPLDPTHPSLRLAHILKDSQATLILDSDASLKTLELDVDIPILDIKNQAAEIDQHSTENLSVAINPQDLAYIIYTSGSTGKPKGVPIRHHSLVNLLTSMAKAPGIDSEDSFLAVTTVAFDIATLELLLPLTVGARLVIASSETVRDSDRIITQLENDEITIMQATPATWRMLLDSGWQGSQNLKIFCGGEALDFPLAQQLLPCCQELWNLYGPTETTIWSAAIKIDKEILSPGFVPIGSPIDNTQFYILDQHGQLVPQGTPGELHIGGAGLSTGYLNRPNLTAEKFVSLPTPKSLGFPALNPPYNLPPHHSLRLYKTGDLVRYHQNNTLEYLGRLDHQIKLRGFRIELGEIEAVLNNHDDVDQSLVMLRHDDNGEPQLVAYCKVWADVDVENPSNIRQHISSQLPTYMVPTAYVLLLDFPLTPNGKIDRKALPEPTINQSTAESRSPQTQTEQQLATIWAQTLNLSTIHATDNFFDLGGHSLLAARVVAQLQPTFGVSVPLRSLFESPTLSDFATAIDAAKQDDGFTPVQIIDREQPLPLSYAQQRQWVLSQLEPDNPFYNIPAALRLEENLSLPLLNQSLAYLCQRHEELRTTFTAVNGEAQLSILPTVTPEISYVDARESDLSTSQIKDQLREAARKPFNLETAPLLRVEVIQAQENLHYILVVVHHIIADATSVEVLMKEIVHVYSQLSAGEAVSLSPLPTGYVDYAAWQRELDTTDQLAYWKEQLKDIPPLLSLPTDYPRPAVQQFEGGSYRFTLTPEQTTALKQLSRQHSATLFMLLMSAFQSLLHRYSRVEDVVVGTPISNRPQASLEGVLGMFVNTLVLRGEFSADLPFTGLLEQMRSTALSAYANQDVPFEQLLEVLSVPRNWSHSPLFQIMFVWQDNKTVGGQKRLQSSDSAPSWSPLPLDSNTTKVDLTLSMAAENSEAGEFLSGKFEYRQDLFKAATVETMADAFFTLLEAIVQAPDTLISQLPLVSEKQRLKLQQWNDTARDYSDEGCLHQLFEQQVVRSPQATALITPTQTLSYQILNTKADQLARQLQALGIKPEARVGICLDRSANLIIAILAVLKSGGAYVPLDPDYPRNRLTYILEDAEVSVVITQPEYEEITATALQRIVLEDQEASQYPAASYIASTTDPQPNNLAYIIYTSGSTGKPKGVAIEHRSPVALVNWAKEVYSQEQLSGVLAATSVCFDLSIFEIFVPLSSGGSVILADNVLQLPTLPAAQTVTLINTVPTAIAELARINGIPSSVTTINLAGEPIPQTLVQQLYVLGSVQQVFNLYGPSEDTTYSTYTLLSPDDAIVPIGTPIANTQAHILDSQQKPVPIGMPGELYLSGQGVARGYWNREALTAEKFVNGQYKTGDLVRHRPDGQLEFLGRIDNQVKVRGFRIELGEIESALLQDPHITQAVARDWSDDQNNHRLVAYVALENPPAEISMGIALSSTSTTYEDLRAHLQQFLPNYMVPAVFVPLEALPLLPNGKIDRKNLPAPLFDASPREEALPLTSAEQTLVEIWQTLLNQPVGIHDNFFELGGDSILAIQAIAQAQQSGLYFSPRDLFQHSTISQLASIAKTQANTQAQQGPIAGAVPLTPIQHWFFGQHLTAPHHWNQSVLLTVNQALQPAILEQALQQLMHHHDALRATFHQTEKGWSQVYGEPVDAVPLQVIQRATENTPHVISTEAEAAQSSFDLANGPLIKVIYYDLKTPQGPERRLLIVCHHLVIDGLSWRILLGDLQLLYQQHSESAHQSVSSAKHAHLPPKTTACLDWVKQLNPADFIAEQSYWEEITTAEAAQIPQDFLVGLNTMASADTISVSLDAQATEQLLREIPTAYSARTDDILLTALLLTFASDTDEQPPLRISLEGHGRPEAQDLSRTVGWLTALYPVLLSIPSKTDLGAAIKSVKETLRAIPNQGLGYGVLRYLNPIKQPTEQPTSSESFLAAETPIRFNYLGQTDQLFTSESWLAPAIESTGVSRSPESLRDILLEVNAVASRGQLTFHWTYSKARHKTGTVSSWVNQYIHHLRGLIQHCLSTETDSGYSPADFPQMGLAQDELDDLLASIEGEG